VPDHDVALLRASPQVGEEILCDVINLGIDIEKRNATIRPGPAGHASRTETNDGDTLVRPDADELHDVAYRSRLVVIRQRLAAQRGIAALEAVKRIAMQQLAHVTVEVVNHFLDAEEVAIDFEDLIIVEKTGQRQTISDDQHCQCERKSEHPLSR